MRPDFAATTGSTLAPFSFLTVYNVTAGLDPRAVPVPAGTAINEASLGQAPT